MFSEERAGFARGGVDRYFLWRDKRNRAQKNPERRPGWWWLLFASSNSVDRSDEPDWPCSNTSRSKPSSSSLTFLPTTPLLLCYPAPKKETREICDDFSPRFRGFEFLFFESRGVRLVSVTFVRILFFCKALRSNRVVRLEMDDSWNKILNEISEMNLANLLFESVSLSDITTSSQKDSIRRFEYG